MVKSYLRHGPTQCFGLICSAASNSLYDGKFAYLPALEDVLVWDVKTNSMIAMWHDTGCRSAVTCIARAPLSTIFAVGHEDGTIRSWDSSTNAIVSRFNGHKRAVTALAFDSDGLKLASGSLDTDLIVWDTLAVEGLKRLSGHRDQITAIRFISHPSSATAPSLVLTASKDSLIKVWDIVSWYCAATIVAHHSEIWALDVDPQQEYIIAGGSGGEVKMWQFKNSDQNTDMKTIELSSAGTLSLESKQRVTGVSFHPLQPLIAIQSQERSVEVFRIRSTDERKRKNARRLKRLENKAQITDDSRAADTVATPNEIELMLVPYVTVKAGGRIRSFGFASDGSKSAAIKQLQLFTSLSNNSFEVHSIPAPQKYRDLQVTPVSVRLSALEQLGHRTDIRSLSVSSDDSLLASASNGQVKLWNLNNLACIRTIEYGYSLCCSFLPGNRHLVVGTKHGNLGVLDLASASAAVDLAAHGAAIWSIDAMPNGLGIATASADKCVKFWDFGGRLIQPNNSDFDGRETLAVADSYLRHTRTLHLVDQALALRFSPDGKYVAVALMDSTVKLFYCDTLKVYLSLYGHKLPVLGMDISSDSVLMITSSADKNIKIWGLDFGDCHRSIFAHSESIMQVAFEPNSHYFWSVGKDRLVKYWDGDKFVNIQTMEGHHSEVWALALSHQGNFVVTASHDMSIRVWEKLDEPLFLEEERERELEMVYENGYIDTARNSATTNGLQQSSSTDTIEQASAVRKHTLDSLMAGERLMEALDLADHESTVSKELDSEQLSLITSQNLPPDMYVLSIIEKIPSEAVVNALAILPLSKVTSLLRYISRWVEKGRNLALSSRLLNLLLRQYQHQITSNQVMRPLLIGLRKTLRHQLQGQRAVLEYNLAALRFIRYNTSIAALPHVGNQMDVAFNDLAPQTIKRKKVQI